MSSDVYLFGPFVLDTPARALRRDGIEVALGSRAFDILVALVEGEGQVLTRRTLMAKAWPGLVVEDSNIRVQVGNLRKSLGCGKEGARYIASVAGRGYCFVATVHRTDTSLLAPPPAPSAAIAREVARTSRLSISVPAPPERAIGRGHNTSELTSLLQQHRLVTVLGPGGSGKTTLAVLAAYAQDDFGNAVYFTDLTLVRAGDHLLEALAHTIGFCPSGNVTVPGFADYIKDRKALLILDNCEHIVEAVGDLCAQLLDASAMLTLLCTSREALRVFDERIYLMRPLDFPPEDVGLSADQLRAWPAIQLFIERAEEGGATNVFSDETAGVISSICARLDGNPLAIELAASRVSHYGVQAVFDLLVSGVVLHWQGRRDASPRHKTVETMLDWTYQLLGSEDRIALNRLSVFTGGFSMDTAVKVIADAKLSPVRAAASIANLADRSLVSARLESGETSLRLLDLTRTYASNKLALSAEHDTVAYRHAKYYFDKLKNTPPDSASAPTLREEQLGDLRAAMDWCFSENHDVELGVQLSALLAPVLLRRRLLTECLRCCTRALAEMADTSKGGLTELVLLESLGITYGLTARFGDNVLSVIKRGIHLSLVLYQPRSSLNLKTGLYLNIFGLGRFRDSYELAQSYADLAQREGAQTERVIACWKLGISSHFLGNDLESEEHLTRGRSICLDVEMRPLHYFEAKIKLTALISMAQAKQALGLHDQALSEAHTALDYARSQRDTLFACAHMCFQILLDNGRVDEAASLIDELERASSEYKVASRPYNIEYVKALMVLHGGDFRDAEARLVAALVGLKQPFFRVDALKFLAEAQFGVGHHDEGLASINEAISMAEDTEAALYLPNLLRVKGELLLTSGTRSTHSGIRALRDALAFARKTHAFGAEISIVLAMARHSLGGEDDHSVSDLIINTATRIKEGAGHREVAELRRLADLAAGSEYVSARSG